MGEELEPRPLEATNDNELQISEIAAREIEPRPIPDKPDPSFRQRSIALLEPVGLLGVFCFALISSEGMLLGTLKIISWMVGLALPNWLEYVLGVLVLAAWSVFALSIEVEHLGYGLEKFRRAVAALLHRKSD